MWKLSSRGSSTDTQDGGAFSDVSTAIIKHFNKSYSSQFCSARMHLFDLQRIRERLEDSRTNYLTDFPSYTINVLWLVALTFTVYDACYSRMFLMVLFRKFASRPESQRTNELCPFRCCSFEESLSHCKTDVASCK